MPKDQVSIDDLPLSTSDSAEEGDHEDCCGSSDEDGKMDFNQAGVEGKQVHLLLKGRDDVTLTISTNQPSHKSCKRHGGKHTKKGLKGRTSRPTNFLNSLEYLLYV